MLMSKKSILGFVIGLVTGAAGGSAATYFILKDKMEREKDEEIEEIEAYEKERFENRLARFKEKISNSKKMPDKEIDEMPVDREDEVIANNKGVKKYHQETVESAYGSKRIFGDDVKPVKKSKKIKEVNEEEFMNMENGYEKQTVDILLGDDADIVGFWAYETDNEEFVEKRFGKPLNELLDGRTYDDLMKYCEDDGLGTLYLKNDDLKIDFEFVIHDLREDDKS